MKINKLIKPAIAIIIIILIIAVVATLMLRYEVEGEVNMPFNLSKIMVISSAEGIDIDEEENENTWNFELIQNNDIYIEIEKNDNYNKTEVIDEIILDNFIINENPEKGNIVIYRPMQEKGKIYDYSEQSIVTEKIEYIGSQKTDMKSLEIANQGGRILFRYSIKDLGNYISNEAEEIIHDGTILKNASLTTKQLKAKVSFDITIKLVSDKSYKANITLDIPVGDVVEEGTSSFEKTDFTDVVFKRM